MTLTELRYIVAVARKKHFGRAAQACFVSQPSLSNAVRRLEDELGVQLFERGGGTVSVTPVGEDIVRQAQSVLEQADMIKGLARRGRDPLGGPLRLGVIYTVAPYLLPELVRCNIRISPQMPLVPQENFTVNLLEMLRNGDLDALILAEPFPDAGLDVLPLYDESFVAAVPINHRLARRKSVSSADLRDESLLLLSSGHCFRSHVLQVCPEFAAVDGSRSARNDRRRSFEGSSLETIVQMVAAGLGVTLVPRLAVPSVEPPDPLVKYLPVVDDDAPPPTRRIVLTWRKSFTRRQAVTALYRAVEHCRLPGVTKIKSKEIDEVKQSPA